MAEENFCLRWNEFEANIQVAFRQLRDNKEFFDVTLVCGDEQVQAHKLILSACSPFFRNILHQNPHQHPLLYLKGVKFSHLQHVLNFMYHGEVNVAQDDLNPFLAVAEDLKVKGLTENRQKSFRIKTDPTSPPKKPKPVKPEPDHSIIDQATDIDDDDEIQEVFPIKSESKQMPSGSNFVLSTYQEPGYDFEDQDIVDYGEQVMQDAGYSAKGIHSTAHI